jgi:chromosome partitioning protein
MIQKAEIVAFTSQKGGTGKTTSCLSIAGYLAKRGKRVLVIDMDPHASATSGLGIDSTQQSYTIYDVLLNPTGLYEGVPITDTILETSVKNLYLVPSEFNLCVIDFALQEIEDRHSLLTGAIQPIQTSFDYILLDLPPTHGLLTLNGLYCAHRVIVPVDPSIYSLESLDNLKLVLDDVQRIRKSAFKKITVILTRYMRQGFFSRLYKSKNSSEEVKSMLSEKFDSLFIVPYSEKIYETQKEGIPISHYDPNDGAGKVYDEIAASMIQNVSKGSE